MVPGFVLLALLWAAYCAVHSVLISISVTNWFKAVLADGYRFYRLFFNIFSIAALIPLVVYSKSERFNSEPLLVWSGHWWIVRYPLIVLGVALVVSGARHYAMQQFLGIDQIRKKAVHSAMTGNGDFDDTGVLGFVRHPWYVAVFLLLWTRDLNAAEITVNLVLSAYLVLGTLLEERKLAIEFGEEYRRYQHRVSMFVPLKWLGARRSRRTRP